MYDENFPGGRGGDTFKPPPSTNNFCLYPPPVFRCFCKDPLMTPHHPTKHPSLLPLPKILIIHLPMIYSWLGLSCFFLGGGALRATSAVYSVCGSLSTVGISIYSQMDTKVFSFWPKTGLILLLRTQDLKVDKLPRNVFK